MKNLNRIVIAFIIVVALVSPTALPFASNAVVVEAATAKIQINKKSVTLEIGKTTTLKVTGTKSKVNWSSSNKKVASILATGKVTAIATGTTKITATVDGKKYTCTVTVIVPVNPYIKSADFDAVEVTIDNSLYLVVPKDWNYDVSANADGTYTATLATDSNKSNIIYSLTDTGEAAPSYEELKAYLQQSLSQKFIEDRLSESGVTDAIITDFTSYDYASEIGSAYVTSYTVTINGVVLNQVIFDLCLNNYFIEVTSTDADNIDVDYLAAYTIDSMRIIK